MIRAYKIIRFIAIMLLAAAVLVPASLYVALSMPAVQQKLTAVAEKQLSQLLNADVEIEHIDIAPFNRLTAKGVTINDSLSNHIASVRQIGVGISISRLFKQKLVFNYAEIIGLDARLRRATPESPLNIQPIIDALKPRDTSKPKSPVNFRVNAVIIRNSAVSYDIESVAADTTRFNPAHIHIRDIRADIELPVIKNDNFKVLIHRLSFAEASGFNLKRMEGRLHLTPDSLIAENFKIELPKSLLSINNQKLAIGALKNNPQAWKSLPVNIEILQGSHLYLPDFAFILPALKSIPHSVSLNAQLHGSPDNLTIAALTAEASNIFSLHTSGTLSGLFSDFENAAIKLPDISLQANCRDLVPISDRLTTISANLRTALINAGTLNLTADLSGSPKKADLSALLRGEFGTVSTDLSVSRLSAANTTFKGSLKTDCRNLSPILSSFNKTLALLETIAATADFNLNLKGKNNLTGSIDADVSDLIFRNVAYHNLLLSANVNGHDYSGNLSIDNPGVALDLMAEASLDPDFKTLDFNIKARDVNLAALNLLPATNGHLISMEGNGQLSWPDIDHINGSVILQNLAYLDAEGKGPKIDVLSIMAKSSDSYNTLRIVSDPVDVNIHGDYAVSEIPHVCKSIFAKVFPAFADSETSESQFACKRPNNLNLDISIKDLEQFGQLIKLPVKIVHPIDITGDINGEQQLINLRIDAPYLQKGNSIVEGTSIRAGFDGAHPDGRANIYATTQMPTKKGMLTASLSSFGTNGQLDTQLSWNIVNPHLYNGALSFSTRFSRPESNPQLSTDIVINPGKIVINDTTWTVDPSNILIENKHIAVNNFKGGRNGQYIKINGVASDNPDDMLKLTLHNMDLDYVFETLGIENAMFGGRATGDFIVRDVFTSAPVAFTPELDVQNLKYNHSVLGNAKIQSGWDAKTKAVNIDALIIQPQGKEKTRLYGKIMPMADSLDLNFDARRIPVGFLQHFMKAFATKVTGYASGKARLWGTFKLVDMVGDIYGEDIAITLGFTNTTYTTTDSVHLSPGRIDLNNLTIHDKFNNTATLNGWLTHTFFKEPHFEFNITNAQGLLVYDISETTNARWYGTVFGNGGASVAGRPGFVSIGVNVATAPNSNFSFVLSDAKEAADYNFITFRDRDQTKKALANIDLQTPQPVQELKRRLANNSDEDVSSIYNMNIAVDVNNYALINLVMDPVGGDKISARGNGNLRLAYNSANDDLRMFGKYTLSRGNYNFTLQDIIIKDFSIRDGSSITFHGDPYAAQLDIAAAYSLNANLSDLDESFLEDKELNRTNVPVRAILKVDGDVRAPEISFDLEFPTLSSDTYRKVKSIISTDDMMNRQIIYLLSLNRFYTPDYMSATKGNELVSVASSTISSQLSNILGQISDNWNISPNFRSDRGDFTDLEVDLALSSQLLNNRLLLNGNFGYRDKALNNNSFIGDFDIEYLLNRAGTIRLKAYNRYNDRNYYVKSALTTQGVGVVFKRDFDSFSSFLRPFLRKRKSEATAPDSTSVNN